MRIGMFEKRRHQDESDDYPLTPFKLFHLRRTYLVWANSHKFDKVFTAEERQVLMECERTQFKWSVSLKMMGVLCFMHLRFFRRPVGRPWLFDMTLLYTGSYLLLGSNIPGVCLTWDKYCLLIEKMFESAKMKKRGLRNTYEFMDESWIPDYRVYYHYIDMQFGKFY